MHPPNQPPASDSTIKRRDSGKHHLFSRLSLNIKIADKGKEMNLHQSEGLIANSMLAI